MMTPNHTPSQTGSKEGCWRSETSRRELKRVRQAKCCTAAIKDIQTPVFQTLCASQWSGLVSSLSEILPSSPLQNTDFRLSNLTHILLLFSTQCAIRWHSTLPSALSCVWTWPISLVCSRMGLASRKTLCCRWGRIIQHNQQGLFFVLFFLKGAQRLYKVNYSIFKLCSSGLVVWIICIHIKRQSWFKV